MHGQNHIKYLDIISKNSQIPNSMKIRAVGAELLHADRRTDMMQLIVAFRNFAKALQNGVRFFAADICKLTV